MDKIFKGFGKVFGFTLKRQLTSSRFISLTMILFALLFVLPALLIPAVIGGEQGEQAGVCGASKVYIVDNTNGDFDFADVKKAWSDEDFDKIEFVKCSEAELGHEGDSLWLFLDIKEGTLTATAVLPDESELSYSDADSLSWYIGNRLPYIAYLKSGIDNEEIRQNFLPATDIGEGEETETPLEQAKGIIGMIIPYVIVMLLYFMILFYGQGVSNSVILEKTSKLMDTFLVAVRPSAMILGKLLAVVSAAYIQLLTWGVGLVGGFAVGASVAESLYPAANSGLLQLLNSLGSLSGMFEPAAVILALLIIVAGFLLYCALAAIGGALASRPEDLSTTNMLFTLALVASFMIVVYSSDYSSDGMAISAEWMHILPFTAILVTPGGVLTGTVPISTACISLVIIVICALLLTVLAGKLYQMTVFYKGKPMQIGEALKQLFNK